jgi:hypothetical protein
MVFRVSLEEDPRQYLKNALSSLSDNVFGSRHSRNPSTEHRATWDFRKIMREHKGPDFRRLEGENDESWVARVEGEQQAFIDLVKAETDRQKGDSQKMTLERLDLGYEISSMVLTPLQYRIDSETQPLEWKAYKAFSNASYGQYDDLAKSIFKSEAFKNAPQTLPGPADHPAVLALGSLMSRAKHGEIYARNINERLAKAWANGEHRPVFRKLRDDEGYPKWELRQILLRATGVTIEGGLNDFESCFYTFKDLPAKLDESFKEAKAQNFYEGYASVCELYDRVTGRILMQR